MGDEVDFVVGDTAPDQQAADPRPRGPGGYRALVLLGVLVVAGVVIATVVRHDRGDEHPAGATPTPSIPDFRTVATVASGPTVPTDGSATCPRGHVCTLTHGVPDALIAAVLGRFPGAALNAGRTQLATPVGRPPEVWERNVRFQDDDLTLVIAVTEPSGQPGAAPAGTRTIGRPVSDGRYLTVRATASPGDRLPDYVTLQALADDDRLLAT